MKGKNKVLEIRNKLGMTQIDFSNAIKITQSAVSRMEMQKTHPSFQTSRKIVDLARSKGLKITLEDVRQD